MRIPVACVSDDAVGDEQSVPLERLVPAVGVEDDGSFRIEGTIEEDGTDLDELHSFLPTGTPLGTAEEALDCACGLYLNNPTVWSHIHR